MTFPLIGLALLRLTELIPHPSPVLRRGAPWLPVAGIAVALIASWALLLLPSRAGAFIFAGWTPLSSLGVPLALSFSSSGVVIVSAWTAILAVQMLSSAPRDWKQQLEAWLSLPALALVAMGDNLLALIVGLGALDMLMLIAAIREQPNPRVALAHYLLNSASLALTLALIVAHVNNGNSLMVDMTRIAEPTAHVFFISVALRLGSLPVQSIALGHTSTLPTLSGLSLLPALIATRAAPLPTWFAVLIAVSAAVNGLLSLATTDKENATRGALISSAQWTALAAISEHTWASASATAAWLVGTRWLTLERTSPGQRGLQRASAALVVVAPIISIGLQQSPTLPELLSATGLLAMVMLIAAGGVSLAALWRITAFEDAGSEARSRPRATASAAVLAIQLVGALVLMLAHSDPSRANWVRAGLSAVWLVMLLVIGWAIHRLRAQSGHSEIAATLARVTQGEWALSVLAGALERLSAPFRNVFDLLERDGVLLWAVTVALLILAFSSSANP